MIKAEIAADSINGGNRLTTLLVTFPRFILAELNTHRMLSKNSASSRAIPLKKMIQSVKENPFIPIAWQKEHKGMQGTEYITSQSEINSNISNWLIARDYAVMQAEYLTLNKVTKQLCNRLLEPFMMHTVLISGTEWENFFELRCPQYEVKTGATSRQYFRSRKELANRYPDQAPNTELEWLLINKGQAEIHMMALAEAIWDAMNESKPKELQEGEWHIPFENKIDVSSFKEGKIKYEDREVLITHLNYKLRISTAMSARTSYTIVGDEKEFTLQQQLDLHDRMANQVPFHASPFEHAAKVMSSKEFDSYYKGYITENIGSGAGEDFWFFDKKGYGWCRNYRGFIQYREILENGTN